MTFVRKIIDSQLLEGIVDIPRELKNKPIEMLLLPVGPPQPDSRKPFDPKKFRGVTNINEKTLKKQIQELRDE